MARISRTLGTTAGLIAAGMVCGALAGVLAVSAWLMLLFGVPVDSFILLFVGIVGAVLGGIAAPLLAWTMLRRVPLGRMFAWCSVGTMVGGIVGGLVGAFVGCLCAAVALHGISLESTPKALQ